MDKDNLKKVMDNLSDNNSVNLNNLPDADLDTDGGGLTQETIHYLEQIQKENQLIDQYLTDGGDISSKLSNIERILLEELKQINLELIDLQKKMDGYNKPAPRIVQVKVQLIEAKSKILKQLADMHLTKFKLDIESEGAKNAILQIVNDQDLIKKVAVGEDNPQQQKSKPNHKIELANDFLDEPLFE
jgi:hypothetical protein